MAFRVPLLFLTLAFAGPASVWGEDVLGLEEALRTTLERNAGLDGSRAAARSAAADADAARSGWLPRLAVSEGWQRGDLPVFVFSSLLSSRRFGAQNFAVDALNHPGPLNFFHASVSGEQLLFDGGRTGAGIAAAGLQREMAEAGVDEAAAGLAVAATGAYGRILAAEAARRAADAAAEAAQQDRGRAEARRDAGTATDADVLSLAVHLAAMRQRAIQAEGDAAIARAELNRLMGSPIDREYTVAEPSPPPEFTEATLAQLFAEAERARPELRRAAAAEALAATAQALARGSLLPTAAAQGAYELNGTRYGDRAGGWMVGAELRWTFSTGGAELARLRAAGEQAAQARAEAAEARAAIQVEVLTARRALDTARAREDVARAAVAQAVESQRIIRDRFEAGLAPVEEVLRASTALVEAESNRTAALVGGMAAAAALRRALGRSPYE